jgi:HAD superfamily hydrolase (TIGR01509 family)
MTGEGLVLFRAVLFDIDGTLIDSNRAHARAWSAALAENGFEVPTEAVLPLIGMGSEQLLARLTGLAIGSAQGKKISERSGEVFDACFLTGLRAFPGARDLVVELKKRGLRVAVATSAGAKDTQKLLEQAGIGDVFDRCATSDDAEKSKPAPDIIAVALDKVKVPAEQVVMVGDTPYDIQCARRNGVACIAVRCGGWSDDRLEGAIAVFDDTAGILSHLDEPPLATHFGWQAAHGPTGRSAQVARSASRGDRAG